MTDRISRLVPSAISSSPIPAALRLRRSALDTTMNDLRLKRRPRRAAGTAADRTTRTKTMNWREVAAEYIGISASAFDLDVKDGTLPNPRKFRGRAIWDRR